MELDPRQYRVYKKKMKKGYNWAQFQNGVTVMLPEGYEFGKEVTITGIINKTNEF